MPNAQKKFLQIRMLLSGALFIVVLFSGISLAFAQDIGTQVNEGLNYATAAGLGTRDVREVIFLIINVIFGFLGVAAVLIILYGGFVWMTAGGDRAKIERARAILLNAAIGLVIIFASYAIAAFVVRQLAGITGGGGGAGTACTIQDEVRARGKDSDDCALSQKCALQADGSLKWGPTYKEDPNCPLPLACYPKNITPISPPDLKIKNVVVRVGMNQNVRSNTVGQESFLVTVSGGLDEGAQCVNDKDCKSDECLDEGGGKKCKGSSIRGDYRVSGKTLEFRPYRECPDPNQSRRCFSDNTKYDVEIADGPQNIFCSNGSDVDCSLPGSVCSSTFTTGSIVDVQAPEIQNLSGQICENSQSLKADVRDDNEVAQVTFFADASEIEEKLGSFGKNNIWETVSLNPLWDPPFLKDSLVNIKVEAQDIDDNSKALEKRFRVRPSYCCNGVWDGPGDLDLQGDPPEERVDCGGLCGACGGSSCDADLSTLANPQVPGSCTPNSELCAYNACDSNTCECISPPIIDYISPSEDINTDNDSELPSTFDEDKPFGAKGNIITIFGRNFGSEKGKVEFDSDSAPDKEVWVEAVLAEDALIGVCKESWKDDRIVVIVPDLGAAPREAGPIRVTAKNGFSDTTGDTEPGERKIPDFLYTDVPLPGLCLADPSSGAFRKLITLKGINLKGPPAADDIKDVRFGIFPSAGFELLDKNTIQNVGVPNLKPGSIAWITASAGARKSNAIPFFVRAEDEGPVIYSYSPESAAPSDYVTIIGARFGRLGSASQVVFLGNAGDAADDVLADIVFPQECQEDYWTETKIIVKVPQGAKTGHIKVIRNDLAETSTADTAGLKPITIAGGEPKPGICKIEPLSGAPLTTQVTLFGERFEEVDGVKFFNAGVIKDNNFTFDDGKRGSADTLKTAVPSDARTGDVVVLVENPLKTSNGIPFTVGACASSNACADPNSQECCLSGEFANQCMPQGRCVGTKNRGAYRWSFVAGNLGPKVILDCQRTNSCSRICAEGTDNEFKPCRSASECVKDDPATKICVNKECTEGPHKDDKNFECAQDTDCFIEEGMCTSPVSSPAPYFPRDKEVPVNVVITATFSELMDEATLNYMGDDTGTILVRDCGDKDPGDSIPCAGNFVKDFELTKKTEMYSGSLRSFIQLKIAQGKDLNPETPSPDFKPGTWYQIVLVTQDDKDADFNDFVQSSIRIPLNGNRGPESNFIWRFKTRASTKFGDVGCIDCAPKDTTLREKQEGDFTVCNPNDPSCEEILGIAFSQDNVCVPLDQSSFSWQWTSSDKNRVELKELPGRDNNDESIVATAQGETSLKNPVLVSAELPTGHKTQCEVAVDFRSPVVADYLPKCGTACANAAIQLVFSKLMDGDSVKQNTALYSCGGDFSCENLFAVPIDIVCKEIDRNGKLVSECMLTPQLKYTINERVYSLVPGNYYRVIVRDFAQGAKSTEGVALSGLNYDDKEFFKSADVNDSFSYTFRVGVESSLCLLNRVEVLPQNASLAVSGTQVFRGLPYSNPDACAPEGQLLDPYGYDWEWKFLSIDPLGAANFNDPAKGDPLAFQGHDGCGNGVVELGEDCDDGNNDAGDGCSDKCLNEGTNGCPDVTPCCGNKKVETGEECDPVDDKAYCSAKCLFTGNTSHPPFPVCGNGVIDKPRLPDDTEECDDGNNRNGDGCSAECIREGSRAGESVCGDGIVGFGEYCEVCGDLIDNPNEPGEDIVKRDIFEGSCPDSQFSQGRPNAGLPLLETDICSTSCKNKEPKPVETKAPYSVCGNEMVEKGEECDPPDAAQGCSNICLNYGSVLDDIDPPSIGPFQMLKGLANGIAEILAQAKKIGTFASDKEVSGTAKFKIGTGIPLGGAGKFKVISSQPQDGSNCKNQNILVKFSEDVLENSVIIDQSFIVRQAGISLNNVVLNIDDNIVRGTPPGNSWTPGAEYEVEILGTVQSENGDSLNCSNGKCSWKFTVENLLCTPRYVEVTPSFAEVPPGEWSQNLAEPAYSAYAYDTTVPPKVVSREPASLEVTDDGENNLAVLKGNPSCNATARLCLKAVDDVGGFEVYAKAKGGDCKTDADTIEITGLYQTAKIQKEVLLIGCSLAVEFKKSPGPPEVNAKLPQTGDLWKIDILEATRPNLAVSFLWEKKELSGDEGDPAVKDAKDVETCAKKECYNFQATDPWSPFTGFRKAQVIAKISDNPEIEGKADFIVGNVCEENYGSGNLYEVYPLKFDADSRLLAHFDDTLKAQTGRGTSDPIISEKLSFDSGLSNGKNTLGKSVKFDPQAKLSYDAQGNIDPKKGSISFWFKADLSKNTTFFSITDTKMEMAVLYDSNSESLKFILDDRTDPDGQREHFFKIKNPGNEWHNVAVTWLLEDAGGGVYNIETGLSYDGIAAQDISGDKEFPAFSPQNQVLVLGSRSDFSERLEGVMDEFEIRSDILTETEIEKRIIAFQNCLGAGVGGEFEIIEKKPSDTECMNAEVSAVFSKDADEKSLLHKNDAGKFDNIILCKEGDDCKDGVDVSPAINLITELSYDPGQRKVWVKTPSILEKNSDFYMFVRSGLNGVKSSDGMYLSSQGSFDSWKFSVGEMLCSCERAEIKMMLVEKIEDENKEPEEVFEDYFFCQGVVCPRKEPTDFDALQDKGLGNDHLYFGSCVDIDESETKLNAENLVFQWSEDDPEGVISALHAGLDPDDPEKIIYDASKENQFGVNSLQNGTGKVVLTVVGKGTVLDKDGNKAFPENPVQGYAKRELVVHNQLCSNRWPHALPKYDDADNNANPDTNWNFWYCRDRGSDSLIDDLPAMSEEPKVKASSLPKDVIFPLEYHLPGQALVAEVIGFDNNKKLVSQEFSGDDYLTECNNGQDDDNDSMIDRLDPQCGNNSKHLSEEDAGLDVDKTRKSVVSESPECTYTLEDEESWTYQFIVPQDGLHELYLEVMNYDPDDPQDDTDSVNGNPADGSKVFDIEAKYAGGSNIQKQTPLADRRRQFVYFDTGFIKAGKYDIEFKFTNGDEKEPGIWEKNLAVCKAGISKSSKISDVIGVKVIANPLHLNPGTWYRSGFCIDTDKTQIDNVCFTDSDCRVSRCLQGSCNDQKRLSCTKDSDCQKCTDYNVPNRGEFTETSVDGYPAIRSGRTVYVNGANRDGGNLYTNIYLISYNENAGKDTVEIFSRLLQNWNIEGDIEGTPSIRNDVRRFGDIEDIRLVFRDFYKKFGFYPLWDSTRKQFVGGTYVPGLTISNWPSWQNTLGRQVGKNLPKDPSGEFRECPPACCSSGTCSQDTKKFCGVNPTTCWDESSLQLYCPETKTVYGYQSSGSSYRLGATFEYKGAGAWAAKPPIPEKVSDLLGKFCGNALSGDLDGDGVLDTEDNCPPSACKSPLDCANPSNAAPKDCNKDGDTDDKDEDKDEQCDVDDDGRGDICDFCLATPSDDPDHDGICDDKDNCPNVFNPDQKDSDNKGGGDACDLVCLTDTDGDGVCDNRDNCPNVVNPLQENFDGAQGMFQYPPYVPRYCRPGSPEKTSVGNVCIYDDMCGGEAAKLLYCLTPDQIAGQVWPNGLDFGDACDPNTDNDNDGYATGFCGGYSYVNAEKMRLCNVHSDCKGFVAPLDAAQSVKANQEKCLRLPASSAAKLDNCSVNSRTVPVDIPPNGGLPEAKIYSADTYVTTFNPGQEDLDRDLIGYLCDECIDSDSDGFTDAIINESFETGISKWKTNSSEPLKTSLNYRHLDDISWQKRTSQDLAYRGRAALSLKVEKAGTKAVYKTLLPGPSALPQNVQNRLNFDEQIQYIVKARVKTQSGAEVALRVMRGCTNVRNGAQFEIPYFARCKGAADIFYETDTEGFDSLEWNEIIGEFYVNFESAQNEIAFIFEASSNDDTVYIDDFQIFYASNIGRERGISCESLDRVDNCKDFRNISRCVGGKNNGLSCVTNDDCKETAPGAPERKFASCKEILDAGMEDDPVIGANKPYYTIYPGGGNSGETVICDMTIDGGGWTLVARITEEDGVKNWSAKTSSELGKSWWFNGAAGGRVDQKSSDYKARAFDSIVFKDILVTFHKRTSDVKNPPLYGLYADDVGDGTNVFASQPIWSSDSCPNAYNDMKLKKGERGAQPADNNFEPAGFVLGTTDAPWENPIQNGVQMQVCAKKQDQSSQKIENQLVNQGAYQERLDPNTGAKESYPPEESPEISVIGIFRATKPDRPENVSPQGLGNYNDGGNKGGVFSDFSPISGGGPVLLSSENYGLLWFREGAPLWQSKGDGICIQPDFDEDNIGDSCDVCTDRDFDGFGDKGFDIRGCIGSQVKTDNCPVSVNPSQADYDTDSNTCDFTLPLPYNPLSQAKLAECRPGFENTDPCCKNPRYFKPDKCGFCGGDACDLDADQDRCYNWEQLRKPANHEFDLPEWNEVEKNLRLREEGYLLTGKNDEKTYLSYSSDSDNDGLASDCDKQTCGNGILENINDGLNQCQNFSIGARMCEECDLNDFGAKDIIFEGQNLNKYMTENLCASCNNLQCQLNYLRTCMPLTSFTLDTSKVFDNPEFSKPQNKTEFVWVLDSPSCSVSGNIRRVAAIPGTDNRPLGDNYGNTAISTVDPERGKGNNGDFSVFIDGDYDKNNTFSGLRVWVPYEDAGDCGGGADKGIFREIQLKDDYSLSKVRNCVLGTSDSGITRSTVDMKGNGWAFSPGIEAILMDYLKDQDPDGACNETDADGISDHLYRLEDKGIGKILAMEVDGKNNLWAVRDDDRILKINLDWIYAEFLNPARDTKFDVSTGASTCTVSSGAKSTACWIFNVPNADEIALDSKNNLYAAKYANGSKEVYKILSTATQVNDVSTITLTSIFKPRFLTVDIQDNLWVSGEQKSDGTADNLIVKVSTAESKEVLVIDPPLAENYGIAADSAGYLWVMNQNGDAGNIAQYRLDGTPGKLANPVIGGRGTKRSAIKTGLSPRMIKLFSDVSQFMVPQDLEAISTAAQGKWTDRWGKILYDVEPAQALDTVKKNAYVSLSDSLDTLGNNWVLVEEFNSRISREPVVTMDEYFKMTPEDKEKNKNRELAGKYMKIKFDLVPDKNNPIKIKNIRVTCKDSAGKNICL